MLRWKPHPTHPEGCVDSAGERVQDVDILMLVQQDEAQEDLQKGWLGNAAQKKVQICCGSHDLLHCHLWSTIEQREHSEHPSGIQFLPPPWPCKGKNTPAPGTPSEEALNPNNFHPSSGHFCPLTQPGGNRGIKKQFRDSAPLISESNKDFSVSSERGKKIMESLYMVSKGLIRKFTITCVSVESLH